MSERYFVCNAITGKVMFEGEGDYTLIDFAEFGPGVTARSVRAAHPFDHYIYDPGADDFVYVGPPDPDNEPASWEQIRDWREAHKRAPVETSQGVFDADDVADQNFKGMIKTFDYLPTLDAQNRITWKRADNSFVPLSKPELIQVYEELEINRAVRGSVLHVKAEQFDQMNPTPTANQLKDMTFWLT